MKLKFPQIICLALVMLSFNYTIAQTPQKMSYQSVVRNSNGNLVVETLVSIKISILQGSATGSSVFEETHSTTTNANGLATIAIGGGTAIKGTFSDINWGAGTYFIKTETDPTGSANYTISGTSQLLSVPYALYAENVRNQGRVTINITGAITNEEAQAKIDEQLGPNTENIYISGTTKLTSIDLSAASSLVNLKIEGNYKLTNINIQNLAKVDNVVIERNDHITNLNFPSLLSAENIACNYNTKLVTIEFPQLSKSSDRFQAEYNDSLANINLSALQFATQIWVGNNICNSITIPKLKKADLISIYGDSISSIDLSSLEEISVYYYDPTFRKTPNLTSINFDSLKFIYGDFTISGTKLTSLTFPNLQAASGQIIISDNSFLTSCNFPMLTNYLTMKINSNSMLSAIELPSLSQIGGNNNYLTYFAINALSSAQINKLLNKFSNVMPTSGKIIDLKNQKPAAPPTGQGIVDKAALINAGNNVVTD